jgi:ubiquinone/menaquinone biosynthesis C-methylase UbiE
MAGTFEQARKDRHRPAHARRTADSHAAFFLPYVSPGMALVDLGCGPASITVGLAAAVAPGHTTGVDLDPVPPAGAEGVSLVQADVRDLPFPDAAFDALFACALLQHLPDPLPALREAFRVARPGAVIGIADIDTSCYLISAADPWLTASFEVNAKLRAGSPQTGRQLRGLLHEAGFRRCVAQARVFHHGDPAGTQALAEANTSWLTTPEVVERVVAQGWATAEEMAAMSSAWAAWSQQPGAFFAGVWCEAIGWAE